MPVLRPVWLASPYSGEVARNLAYLDEALLDSIRRGEAPFAPHAIYPKVLRDDLPEDRELGMAAGHVWLRLAHLQVFYTDLGWSQGMLDDLEAGRSLGIPSEFRGIRGYIRQPSHSKESTL